ncbi:hypothetical protein MCOR31_010593 [Pyricularia oryzae]|nr:hypothetical protein MCOR31_010593 [Pyricularia oryzae]KAI6455117.1 hypothetical protein MCOR15_007905 [Pyricularia oryzae]KAI6634814.1 hypothetical protein MCOR14_006039 [Pyricularia oryzae]
MRCCTFFATVAFALSVYANTGNVQNHGIPTIWSTTGNNGNGLNTNGFAKYGTGHRIANKKSGFAGHGPSNRAAQRACHRRGGKLVRRQTGHRKTPGTAFSGGHGPRNRAAHRVCHRRGGKLVARAMSDDESDAESGVDDAESVHSMKSCVTDEGHTRAYDEFTDRSDEEWIDPGTDTESCVIDYEFSDWDEYDYE